MCAELANRGVKDVLIVEGAPPARERSARGNVTGSPAFPRRTQAVLAPGHGPHLRRYHPVPRPWMRFVSYGDRRKVAAALKAVYTAPNQEAAWQALTDFSESDMGVKHPSDGDDLPAGLGAIHPFFLDSPADAQACHLSPTSWEVPPPPTVSRLRATSCARFPRTAATSPPMRR